MIASRATSTPRSGTRPRAVSPAIVRIWLVVVLPSFAQIGLPALAQDSMPEDEAAGLGYPLGQPNDPPLQRRILRALLRLAHRDDVPVREVLGELPLTAR